MSNIYALKSYNERWLVARCQEFVIAPFSSSVLPVTLCLEYYRNILLEIRSVSIHGSKANCGRNQFQGTWSFFLLRSTAKTQRSIWGLRVASSRWWACRYYEPTCWTIMICSNPIDLSDPRLLKPTRLPMMNGSLVSLCGNVNSSDLVERCVKFYRQSDLSEFLGVQSRTSPSNTWQKGIRIKRQAKNPLLSSGYIGLHHVLACAFMQNSRQ
jgi:hypothetical protein